MLSFYDCPAEEEEESTGMAHKAEHADWTDKSHWDIVYAAKDDSLSAACSLCFYADLLLLFLLLSRGLTWSSGGMTNQKKKSCYLNK